MNKSIAIITLCLATSGCATIVSDSSYPVTISSSPSNASFVVTNESGKAVHSGVTPDTVTLKSSAGYFNGETYTVKYKKEGYSDGVSVIDSELDGWYFGNFLIGHLWGFFLIDPISGAMWELPDDTSTRLSK